MDSAADIVAKRITVAFNEDRAAQGNHLRVHSCVAFTGKSAERRKALAAAIIRRISGGAHMEKLFVFP